MELNSRAPVATLPGTVDPANVADPTLLRTELDFHREPLAINSLRARARTQRPRAGAAASATVAHESHDRGQI